MASGIFALLDDIAALMDDVVVMSKVATKKTAGILGDDLAVNAVVKAVKSNLQIDWMNKEDAKAAIRLAVKKELRGKINMSELNDILQEVMEQAEGQFSEWRA